jgi:hypothetical protein
VPDTANAPQVSLSGLIDYAGMYPPESLSLEDALASYRRHQQGAHEWMLGPFLCPSSQLHDLEWLLEEERVPVGVICDQPPEEAVPAIEASGLSIRQIETTDLEIGSHLDRINREVAVWLEAPTERVSKIAIANPHRRIGVKVRCGGATAKAFPSPEALAETMFDTFHAGLPMKATAGLHHPWRHYWLPLEVWRHGFLNLLAAAAALVTSSDRDEVERLLATDQPGDLDRNHLRLESHTFSVSDLRSARVFFRSYGSCSFDEPVDDLESMGSLWGTA